MAQLCLVITKGLPETYQWIAQLLAVFGVIASLFYLDAQLRKSTRSMRAMVVDSLAHSPVDRLRPLAREPESIQAFSVAL